MTTNYTTNTSYQHCSQIENSMVPFYTDMVMCSRQFFFIAFSVLVFAYMPYWIWVGERWFSNTDSLIHPLIVGLLLFLGWHQKIWRSIRWRHPIRRLLVVLTTVFIGIERLQDKYLDASIVSVILILMAFWCLCAGFLTSSMPKSRGLAWSALSFCALPIFPLLGSTIGIVTRQVYTETVWLLFSSFGADIEKRGTSLVSQAYITHIDSACSGVNGVFSLLVVSLLAYLLTKNPPPNFFSIVIRTMGLYLLLNGLRLVGIVLLHNIFFFPQVDIADTILSTIALGGSVLWMFAILYRR